MRCVRDMAFLSLCGSVVVVVWRVSRVEVVEGDKMEYEMKNGYWSVKAEGSLVTKNQDELKGIFQCTTR